MTMDERKTSMGTQTKMGPIGLLKKIEEEVRLGFQGSAYTSGLDMSAAICSITFNAGANNDLADTIASAR